MFWSYTIFLHCFSENMLLIGHINMQWILVHPLDITSFSWQLFMWRMYQYADYVLNFFSLTYFCLLWLAEEWQWSCFVASGTHTSYYGSWKATRNWFMSHVRKNGDDVLSICYACRRLPSTSNTSRILRLFLKKRTRASSKSLAFS